MGTILKVKETPLLMSPDLAQKTFLGLKTVTRRPVLAKLQPHINGWDADCAGLSVGSGEREGLYYCPYGGPGDLLWVRETHYRWTGCGAAPLHFIRDPAGESYEERAYIGDPTADALYSQAAACVLVPSIHMPRWACRTWLKIKSVRAERVQEITYEDCIAEGFTTNPPLRDVYENPPGDPVSHSFFNERSDFYKSWNALYPGSWDRNEWVWRIEFEKTEGK